MLGIHKSLYLSASYERAVDNPLDYLRNGLFYTDEKDTSWFEKQNFPHVERNGTEIQEKTVIGSFVQFCLFCS